MTQISEPASNNNSKLFFTIFLGSPNGKTRLDEHDRVSAIHKVTQKFELFTLVDGKGPWNGQFEDTLIIHIATTDIQSIAELAHTLRSTFDQDGVSIQFGQHMFRAHRGNDTEETHSTIKQLNTNHPTAS